MRNPDHYGLKHRLENAHAAVEAAAVEAQGAPERVTRAVRGGVQESSERTWGRSLFSG
jgi:hypothetical protein